MIIIFIDYWNEFKAARFYICEAGNMKKTAFNKLKVTFVVK